MHSDSGATIGLGAGEDGVSTFGGGPLGAGAGDVPFTLDGAGAGDTSTTAGLGLTAGLLEGPLVVLLLVGDGADATFGGDAAVVGVGAVASTGALVFLDGLGEGVASAIVGGASKTTAILGVLDFLTGAGEACSYI